MKNLIMVAFVAAFVVVLTQSAGAEMRKADLQKRTATTEEGALLSQVDTISLYLSSDRIALAPRLTAGGIIEVESTVLTPDLCADFGKLKVYVGRICETFVSVLKERLPIYTPSLARKFDSSKDIVFVVNAGSGRVPVGTMKNCILEDANAEGAAVVIAPVSELNETRAIEAEESNAYGKISCGCPVKR